MTGRIQDRASPPDSAHLRRRPKSGLRRVRLTASPPAVDSSVSSHSAGSRRFDRQPTGPHRRQVVRRPHLSCAGGTSTGRVAGRNMVDLALPAPQRHPARRFSLLPFRRQPPRVDRRISKVLMWEVAAAMTATHNCRDPPGPRRQRSRWVRAQCATIEPALPPWLSWRRPGRCVERRGRPHCRIRPAPGRRMNRPPAGRAREPLLP